MFGLTRYNISSGFQDYLGKAELSTLDTLATFLEARYKREKSWQFAIDHPQEVWRMIGRSELSHLQRGLPTTPDQDPDDPEHFGPSPGPGEFSEGEPPPPPPPEGNGRRPRPHFPEHRMAFFSRVGIFDSKGKLVWGNEAAGKSRQRIILHASDNNGEVVVGWLKMVPVEKMSAAIENEFLADQNQSLLVAGLISFAVAVAAAILQSKDFLHAIGVLVEGTRSLKCGHYGTRISLPRKDELGQLASDFNSLATTLEQQNRSQKQWITDTSHELRTPIAILRAQVEALQDGVQQVNPRTLGILHSEIITLAKLVDDLHDLAKSDLGELRYDFVPVDAGVVLLDAIDAFGERFAAKAITIDASSVENLHCVVQADSTRLRQLFLNLLENSLRYTNSGGRARISANLQAGAVYIYFDDSEPGVPLDLATKIFDRFFRTEVSRSRISGGAGLGLAICKAIVEAHKGNITATLSDMGGLRVTIRLPIGDKAL